MAAGNPMQTPPFLTKLYQLVNDPATAALVSWTDNAGLSFTVHKPSEFGRDILPRYFKHNNFSSFVRQLNQYGFHKQNPDRWMFGHESFRKDRPDLLKNITRRRPKQAPPTSSAILPHPLTQRSVVELGNYGIEGEVKALKRDKDLLIKELVVTRQNEEQLKNKCDSLEDRVSNLENSSKQMQAFIMHYFSQVLQPYSTAMASRKRKRLPPSSPSPDTMGALADPTQNHVAHVSHPPPNPSVDALRVMMQQMGVGMPPAPASPRPPVQAPAPSERNAFAPATIQELPLDEQLNGSSSTSLASADVPRIGAPAANGPTGPGVQPRPQTVAAPPGTRQPAPRSKKNTTPIPVAPSHRPVRALARPSSQPAQTAQQGPSPNTRPAPVVSPAAPRDHAAGEKDLTMEFLEDIPSTPNSSMTMDLIEHALNDPKDQGNGTDDIYTSKGAHEVSDHDFNPADYEVTFDSTLPPPDTPNMANCSSSKEDEKAIEDFLELSSDDQPLPPPLTHLPEGTDIHALAKRIEGFADSTEL